MPDRVVSHTSSELKHRMPLALVALVFQLQRLEHPGRVRLFSLRSVGSARALGLVGVASCNLPLEHADTTVHDVDHLRRRARLRALDLELRLFLDHVGLALGLAHLDCRLLSTRGDEFILALRARRLGIRLELRLPQLQVPKASGSRAALGAHDQLHLR